MSGWYCCQLWFAIPEIQLDPFGLAPEGVSIDSSFGTYALMFNLDARIFVHNDNIVGMTIHTAHVDLWLSNPTSALPSLVNPYLGGAELADSVR